MVAGKKTDGVRGERQEYIRKLDIRKSRKTLEDFSNFTTNFWHLRHFLLFRVKRVNGFGSNALLFIKFRL